MRLVLMEVQVTKSVDASMTFVQPALPWMESNAPSFEYSVTLIRGPGTKTATTLLWLNRVGTSIHGRASIPTTPSIRKAFAELLTV